MSDFNLLIKRININSKDIVFIPSIGECFIENVNIIERFKVLQLEVVQIDKPCDQYDFRIRKIELKKDDIMGIKKIANYGDDKFIGKMQSYLDDMICYNGFKSFKDFELYGFQRFINSLKLDFSKSFGFILFSNAIDEVNYDSNKIDTLLDMILINDVMIESSNEKREKNVYIKIKNSLINRIKELS